MPRLLIMRHGEAESRAVTDHARHLTRHGREQVRRVGVHMLKLAVQPQQLLVSTAQRTRSTCEVLLPLLPATQFAPQVTWKESIYMAHESALLDMLKQVPASTDCAMLIGHNPGVSLLLTTLIRPSRLPGLPTAGFRMLDFEGQWSELGVGAGKLTDQFNP